MHVPVNTMDTEYIRSFYAVLVPAVLSIALLSGSDVDAQDAVRDVVTVSMEDRGGGRWRFEPSKIVVTRGTIVQFVQNDVVPHNVEFKNVPKGTELGDAKMGPFIMAEGESYDVLIDDRFANGDHEYICTPHAPMGMKGVIRVE